MGGKGSGVSRKRRFVVPRAVRPGWLKRMDQRSQLARALNERLAVIGEDLGGLAELSGIQRSLLERFIHAEALVQEIEDRARKGEPFNTGQYLAITDRVLRIGQTLGLHRKAKRVPTLAERLADETGQP